MGRGNLAPPPPYCQLRRRLLFFAPFLATPFPRWRFCRCVSSFNRGRAFPRPLQSFRRSVSLIGPFFVPARLANRDIILYLGLFPLAVFRHLSPGALRFVFTRPWSTFPSFFPSPFFSVKKKVNFLFQRQELASHRCTSFRRTVGFFLSLNLVLPARVTFDVRMQFPPSGLPRESRCS